MPVSGFDESLHAAMAKVAVIDLGKSNSKLALVDTDTLQELKVYTTPAAVVDDGPYPHLDQEKIEAFVRHSLTEMARESGIDALTVTTHGATGALLDGDGQLALPVMDYEYTAIDEQRDAYNAIRPPFSETGSPALPGGLNLGAQWYWQQQNFSEAFSKTQALLTWPQYWVHWLSGVCVNDVTSLGCHTDLYAPLKGKASSILSRTDWAQRMPEVQNSGTFAAVIKPGLARHIGLPAGLPVHVGIHDSNASLVPYLKSREGAFSVLSTGTWFIAMAIGGKTVALDETRDTLLNVNALGDAVPSARFMGGRERHELLHGCEVDSVADHEIDSLITELLGLGVYILPSQVSQTGPFPDAEGKWSGSSKGLSDQARICAVAMYLAMMSAECLALAGAMGPSFIEGPLAHDALFADMLSVATDREVFVSESMTGTSVGAAMLVASPSQTAFNSSVNPGGLRRPLLARYAERWREHLLTNT